MAKFGIAPVQTAQDHRRGSKKKSGRPGKKWKEEKRGPP